jgi:hypothetical protein
MENILGFTAQSLESKLEWIGARLVGSGVLSGHG